MTQPGRDFSNGKYRFGFNGKENDNEVKGDGNSIDYGMRGYDPRIGRPYSVDPLTFSYPYLSPYQFFSNNPIWMVDLDGKEGVVYTVTQFTANGKTIQQVSTQIDVNGKTEGAMTVLHDLDTKTIQTHYQPDVVLPIDKHTSLEKIQNSVSALGQELDATFYNMRGKESKQTDSPFKSVELGVRDKQQVGVLEVVAEGKLVSKSESSIEKKATLKVNTNVSGNFAKGKVSLSGSEQNVFLKGNTDDQSLIQTSGKVTVGWGYVSAAVGANGIENVEIGATSNPGLNLSISTVKTNLIEMSTEGCSTVVDKVKQNNQDE